MNAIVQTETLSLLKEAVKSNCKGIRFGPEFCEFKMPEKGFLEKAYDITIDEGKTFAYNVPLLTQYGIKKIKEQTNFLKNLDKIEIVIGDLGLINLLKDLENVNIRLGRLRVYIPGRCPWKQITREANPSFFSKRRVEKLFYQTNLNYIRTLDFYKNLGITCADVDWIPKCFSNYGNIVKKGFNLSIHTHSIPVAVTMKCHTARFLGESSTESCTKPCFDNFFEIRQKDLGENFLLDGNVVYRGVNPTFKEIKKLKRNGIDDIVISLGHISNLFKSREIDEVINNLMHGV
jgi:hypothetical protein